MLSINNNNKGFLLYNGNESKNQSAMLLRLKNENLENKHIKEFNDTNCTNYAIGNKPLNRDFWIKMSYQNV